MNFIKYRHYIRLDSSARIVQGFSTAFEKEQDGDICVNEDGSYQFRLTAGGEENPNLFTFDRIPLYRWDGSAVVKRTEAEIEADRKALPPPPPNPIESLQEENKLLTQQIHALTSQNDFQEELIVELANIVYA